MADGWGRGSLQQAWWLHTASGDAIRGDLWAMRADALGRLGPEGIGCVVTSVEDDYEGGGVVNYRGVIGTFTAPSYMSSPEPPAEIVRDAAGAPVWGEDGEVPFTAIIPWSLAGYGRTGPLLTWGHGLLGLAEGSVSDSDLRAAAELAGVVVVGTDWAGMSSHDVPTIGLALVDASNFYMVTERLQQGMINQIALTRSFLGVCRAIPEMTAGGGEVIDPTTAWYAGGSQGGIYGSTLLAISPDIDRGAVLVNGAVFPFMMERSIDYAPYLPVFEASYPRRLDRAVLLPMAQHLWDATDPSGHLPHLVEGHEGIGPKEILSIAALNDAQVPNLSTDQAMRMAGVPVLEGSTWTPWGFDVAPSPHAGSAVITVDMGDRPVPEGNVAPEHDDGGHSAVGAHPTALSMMFEFFQTGQVSVPCDGPCDPD